MAEKIGNYDPDNPNFDDLPGWAKFWCYEHNGEIDTSGKYLCKINEPRFCTDIMNFDLLHKAITSGDETIWNDRNTAPFLHTQLNGFFVIQNLSKNYLETPLSLKLCFCSFKNAKFMNINLSGSDFRGSDLTSSIFYHSQLNDLDFSGATLEKATFSGLSDIKGANFSYSNISGAKLKDIDFDTGTDFVGSNLDDALIDPATKAALQYNIRRKAWKDWYKKGNCFEKALKQIPRWFWSVTDYGISTKRIIGWFFVLSLLFACLYTARPDIVGDSYSKTVEATAMTEQVPSIRGFGHACYFSVVTMTTLGFGDLYANPESGLGQFALATQVLLGYVMLGALITRLGVMFTGSGPVKKPELSPKDQKEHDDFMGWVYILVSIGLLVAQIVYMVKAGGVI